MEIKGTEFDRGDLARNISQKTGIPEETCLQVIEWMAVSIADAIVEFDRVEIHDFGVFTLTNLEADSGSLPDGQPWEAPERLKVVFRPAKVFRDNISRRMLKPVI